MEIVNAEWRDGSASSANAGACGAATQSGRTECDTTCEAAAAAGNVAQGLALEARDFSFTYPDGAAGIGLLDWQVEAGAFQLLVGATGSGKTTLLRCCKPAIAPAGERAGALELFGRPVDGLSEREAAAAVGYVAQSPENQLVCDTVWHELAFGLENLGLPQNEMRRRVAEVAHFFGIEPWFRRAVPDLSGGQKQMVTLASVLALQPRVLLLDEPTAQLDPVAEKNFLHALFRVNRELGITVVVATHAPETMTPYATNLVELQEGKLSVCASTSRAVGAALGVEDHSHGASGGAQGFREGSEALMGGKGVIPAITLRDVYFHYKREDDWVLRGLDLDVLSGSLHALVGGNGCGKSTLLRAVAGVLKSERGRITNRLAARQALLPQDPKALFVCDTVADELSEWQSACGYSDAVIQETLERFGLAARAANHPYDLSGGQQQLLALAKLLLTNPDLLLLDEPTKGLDAPSKLLVAHELTTRANDGTTVLMATHDLAFAAHIADTATMLFDGEAVSTEPAHTFFARNLFYRPTEDAFTRLWREERA